MAGDISPIDVLTHIPIVCEDSQIPYIYVPSKEVSGSLRAPQAKDRGQLTRRPRVVCALQELGAAALSKRPTSCMLVLPKPIKGGADDEEGKEYTEAYAELEKKVKAAMPVF